MKKIAANTFLIILLFYVGSVYADTYNAQTDKTDLSHSRGIINKQADNDWAILIGGIISFPKLDEANQRIHDIEKFLKTLSPEVKTFKDWDDITKGALLIGVKRRIVSNLFLKNSNMWGEIGFAYTKGGIKNSQSNIRTIYGPGAEASYSQSVEYKTWETVFRTTYDFPPVLKLTPTLALAIGYRHLDINSYFNGSIPAIPISQTVNASGNTDDWVYMVSSGLKYTHSSGIFIELAGEYNWNKMKGTLEIDSRGDQLYIVTPDYVVDFTGFSIITFIGKEF